MYDINMRKHSSSNTLNKRIQALPVDVQARIFAHAKNASRVGQNEAAAKKISNMKSELLHSLSNPSRAQVILRNGILSRRWQNRLGGRQGVEDRLRVELFRKMSRVLAHTIWWMMYMVAVFAVITFSSGIPMYKSMVLANLFEKFISYLALIQAYMAWYNFTIAEVIVVLMGSERPEHTDNVRIQARLMRNRGWFDLTTSRDINFNNATGRSITAKREFNQAAYGRQLAAMLQSDSNVSKIVNGFKAALLEPGIREPQKKLIENVLKSFENEVRKYDKLAAEANVPRDKIVEVMRSMRISLHMKNFFDLLDGKGEAVVVKKKDGKRKTMVDWAKIINVKIRKGVEFFKNASNDFNRENRHGTLTARPSMAPRRVRVTAMLNGFS